MPRSREKTRSTLIEAAHQLFYINGYRATGVDRVVEEAGITKKTLYNHFPSKTDLIVAALEHRDALYLQWLEEQLAVVTGDPEARFDQLLDSVAHWIELQGEHGCMFINALAEFGGGADEIARAVSIHKKRVAHFLEQFAREAGLNNPIAVAWQVSLILEGLVSMARFAPLDFAMDNARTLVHAAINLPDGTS